jgi:hypothetical protein
VIAVSLTLDCDRCRRREVITTDTADHAWDTATEHGWGVGVRLYPEDPPQDLCGGCMARSDEQPEASR